MVSGFEIRGAGVWDVELSAFRIRVSVEPEPELPWGFERWFRVQGLWVRVFRGLGVEGFRELPAKCRDPPLRLLGQREGRSGGTVLVRQARIGG